MRGELDELSTDLRQLHQARADLLAAERRLLPARRAVENSAAELETARSTLERALKEGPTHEPPEPTAEALDAIDRRLGEMRERERSALTALTRAQTSLHEFEDLLAAGVCPRCGQTVRSPEFEPHRLEAEQQSGEADAAYRRATGEREHVEEERRSRERYERAYERWVQVERERAQARKGVRAAESLALAATDTFAEVTAAVTDADARRTRATPAESQEKIARAALEASEAERSRLAASVEGALLSTERTQAATAAAEALEAEVARIDLETAALCGGARKGSGGSKSWGGSSRERTLRADDFGTPRTDGARRRTRSRTDAERSCGSTRVSTRRCGA